MSSPDSSPAAALQVTTMASSTARVDDSAGSESNWEEPHPGQRLSFPLEAGPIRDVGNAAIGLYQTYEDVRGDMAAKGLRPFRYNGKLVRRNIRVRTRNLTPNAPKTSHPIPAGNESGGVEISKNHKDDRSSTISTAKLLSTATSLTHTHERGSDTEAGTTTTSNACPAETELGHHATASVVNRIISYDLTDLSNYLGIVADTGDRDSITVIDSDSTHVPSVEDLYGWEASLERKLLTGSGMPGPESVNPNFIDGNYRYRQVNGNKRSLLHRVFNLGNGPRDTLDGTFCTSTTS